MYTTLRAAATAKLQTVSSSRPSTCTRARNHINAHSGHNITYTHNPTIKSSAKLYHSPTNATSCISSSTAGFYAQNATSFRVHSGSKQTTLSIAPLQQARPMSVNLGPREDFASKRRSFGYFVSKVFGRNGGVFGLGALTPLILSAAVIGGVFWYEDYGETALVDKPPFMTPEGEKLWSDNTMRFVSLLPTRFGSQVWGYLTHITLHESIREPIYGFYSKLFDVIMDEVPKPLREFATMNEFFTRRIDVPAVRPIAPTEFVSPVDGTVLVYGDCKDEWSEQVKGVWYSIESLLGADAVEMVNKYRKQRVSRRRGAAENTSLPPLKYCVIYLAPGDYHGIHSPADWTIKDVRHFTGHLFSVSPATSAKLRGLLAVNERVCLSGTSPFGFFSMTPVGAYNVGSITLEWDDEFNTNLREQRLGEKYQIQYENDITAAKGDCLSFFELGSTVVLLFEAPDNFDWKVQPQTKIKLGQSLCGTQ